MVSSQEAGPWRSHRFPLQITVSETQATDSKPLLAPLLNQASISLHETVHLAPCCARQNPKWKCC